MKSKPLPKNLFLASTTVKRLLQALRKTEQLATILKLKIPTMPKQNYKAKLKIAMLNLHKKHPLGVATIGVY